MCGIIGIFNPRGDEKNRLQRTVEKMASSLIHRGPDGQGFWTDDLGHLSFGHRRLAVSDLGESGVQPMVSKSGRYILVFNGEIYNHWELRDTLVDLRGVADCRGPSDTETLLALIDHFGVITAVRRCAGMFAFGVWDRKERCLTLARDRMGEKPLYYGWIGDQFLFASELRAIEAISGSNLLIDVESINLFLQFTYIPGPKTIYSAVKKLPPGFTASINGSVGNPPNLSQYWSLNEQARLGEANPFRGTERDATVELERIFSRVVKRQMLAEVPVGAFLSGGVDSSNVVSEMVRHTKERVNTFTLGFEALGYDERVEARAIAARLGTRHHEAIITEAEALSTVQELAVLYDEPFADSSQIPTVLISRFARQHVTVALTGDGGDEFFGGYPRHSSAVSWRRKVSELPAILRKPLHAFLSEGLRFAAASSFELTPSMNETIRKLAKVRTVLGAVNTWESYKEWVTKWHPLDQICHTAKVRESHVGLYNLSMPLFSLDRELMLIDSLSYLVDQILVKVDRAAMSASLETRAPYLDHELVAFASSLPSNLLMNTGNRKLILRQMVNERIKPLKLKSNKTGFSIPLGDWLRHGLREWSEDILQARTPLFDDTFNKSLIQKVWAQHLSGKKDNSALLWPVLMLKSWALHRSL